MNGLPPRFPGLELPSVRADRESRAWLTLAALRRQAWLIAACILAAGLAGLAVLARLPPTYAADALVQVDFGRDQPAAIAGASGPGIQVDPNALVEGEARLIRSDAVAARVIRQLKLDQDPAFAPREGLMRRILGAWLPGSGSPAERADLVAAALRKDLKVTNDSRSYLITVTYTSTDPARSAAIANAFAEEYLRTRIEASLESADRTAGWLAGQIREVRDALAQTEDEILSFRASSGFLEANPEGSGVQQNQLRDVMAQIETASLARIQEENRLSRAREAVEAGFAPAVADPNDAGLLQRLSEAETTAKRNITETRTTFGARHPGVERAVAAHADAQARLAQEVRRVLAGIETGVAAARTTEAGLQARADRLRAAAIEAKTHEARLRGLQADAAVLRERARILGENHERARALSELKPTTAKIVLPARASTVPAGPNKLLILAIALAGGAGLGVGTGLVLERRDRGFRTGDDLAAETDLPCLGIVPEIGRRDSPLERALFGESIRQLAAALGLYGRPSSRVVLVTSGASGDGKSVVTVALAKCLAEAGRKVLVIDTSPAAADEASPAAGMTLEAYLEGDRAWLEAPDGASHVRLVRRASGVGGGQPLFGGAFDDLIAEARRNYDTILVEAPPVGVVADSLILARSADLVLLAVRWQSGSRAAVQASLDGLARLPVRMAGTVLTRARAAPGGARGLKARAGYFKRHAQLAPGRALGRPTCAS